MRKALLSTLPLLLALVGCNSPEETAPEKKTEPATAAPTSEPASTKNAKVDVKVKQPGKGPAAAEGDTVWVTYVGTLKDGKVFDSSERSGGNPYPVIIGAGQVIKGWEQGLTGAKKGAKLTLNIPYPLAYGETGRSPEIPPRADLVFDIDVLHVLKKGQEDVLEVTELKKGTGPVVKKGSKVTINYVGRLVNGVEFDSSKKLGKPFTFTVGEKETILGMDAGVQGMAKGGKRRIIIPPALGWPNGSENIPPNNPLIYEFEVLSVK